MASFPLQNAATINRQVTLPFKKSVEIAFKSIRARFLRSSLTVLSLVLAVSFLSFIRVGNDIANGLLTTGIPSLRQAVILSGYDVAPDQQSVDSSPKQRWLIILSLLVCVVGIVNAQLMSVTERFREIGTMKCLGALDRFVLRLFLLEAGMQGASGALSGALSGAFFAFLNGIFHFGWAALSYCDWGATSISLFFATAIGCLLSLLGVLYPALLAARMQPVEAMRNEQ